MKRLLAQIGLTYLLVLAIVFYFGKTSAILLSICALVAFVIFLSVKKCRKTIYLPVMAFVALFACVVNIVYTCTVYDRITQTYDGYEGVISAKLKDEPYKYYNNYCYRFTATKINGQECDFDFLAYHSDLVEVEVCDTVDMYATLSKIDDHTKITKGYFLRANLGYDDVKMTVHRSEQKSLYYYAVKLRQTIRNYVDSVMDEDTADLCNALLVGDKFSLSFDVRKDFVRSGSSHLIVVSGLHFSILASFFLMLARRFSRYRFLSLIPATAFIIIYMAVTGFSPSVMRSGIMLMVCVVGLAVFSEPYSPNSLGLSALIVLFIFGPYSAGDVGLLLSFASTYSIVKLSPVFYEYFYTRIIKEHKKRKSILSKLLLKTFRVCLSVVCMNISALIVSVPLSIVFFGAVSTVSVIASLVLVVPIQLLLITCVVMCLLSFAPFATFVFVFVAQLCSEFIYETVSFFGKLKFSYLYVDNNYVYLWLPFSIVLFVLMMLSNHRYRVLVTALSSVLILIVGNISAMLMTQNTQSLYVYDVDEGKAVVYSSPESNCILALDCNKHNCADVVNKLEHTTDKIDFIGAVSNTRNAKNSLEYLSEVFAINDVLLYDTKRTVKLSDTVTNVITPTQRCTVNLSDNAVVDYYLIDNAYVTYLSTEKTDVLILPDYIDVSLIPQHIRSADVIITSTCPENFDMLNCDTLIISADEDCAYHIMKTMYTVSERVLLTAESDVKIKLGV